MRHGAPRWASWVPFLLLPPPQLWIHFFWASAPAFLPARTLYSPTSLSLPLSHPASLHFNLLSALLLALHDPLLTGPTLSSPSRCSEHHHPPPPAPSYFLAVTSQRHPDVRPQITSRDLGFRSEILYFCITGWAPGPRWRKRSPRCHLCLYLRGCDLPLPRGVGWGPAGTSQSLKWALGPLGRAPARGQRVAAPSSCVSLAPPSPPPGPSAPWRIHPPPAPSCHSLEPSSSCLWNGFTPCPASLTGLW